MPGRCYLCGSEFGVFKKEHGCKNCGFSFCNKCLHPKTIRVPKKNNEKHHVCDKCHRILSGELKEDAANDVQYEFPQAYIKRMEALKERESKEHLSGGKQGESQGQKVPSHLRHLSKPDREIAMRLERLKDSGKPEEKVSSADIEARLANIQGQPYRPEQKPVYRPPDRRLQQEQIDDLLDEIAAEVEIDSQAPDPVRDIEERLKKFQQGNDELKGQNSVKDPGGNNLNKDSFTNRKKDNLYNKNIGNIGEGSNQDIDMDELQRLMTKTASEMEMDAQKALNDMQKDKELMEKLKEIQKRKQNNESNEERAISAKGNNSDFEDNDDSEDEEKATKWIIQKYLEEAKIDEKAMNSDRSPPNVAKSKKRKEKTPGQEKALPRKTLAESDEYEDDDELPYCTICTEDAVIRCRDCDMDLYCNRCFRECHLEMEITDHRTSPYKAPKGFH